MPTDIAHPPQLGMISSQEQDYLRRYASCEYSGWGEIVDLGCWLGSSTIELAKALQSNPNAAGRKIHAYDLFLWHPWMEPYVADSSLAGKFQEGDSFFQDCVELTKPWQDQIKFYPGDLAELGWKGGAIEFLFIDAMKNWTLANTIIHDFFPSLIPGKSIVVQQDFSHHFTYWIHLTMYRLRQYFEPIYDIPYSASLVYKYINPIPEELLTANYGLAAFSEEEMIAAFDYSQQLVSADKKMIILCAKVKALTELGAEDQIQQVDSALVGIYSIYQEISSLKFQMEHAQARLQELEQRPATLETSPIPSAPDISQVNLRQKLKTVNDQVQQLESHLTTAQDRIRAMESSKFWQLRTQWFKLKKLLGLPSI